ncbi:MAG: glycosyltransferase family 2 protein [Bradyrhizobium sp.]|uniref:glycosyltransferase family 2 protein n=1 Tax=Bradyrhizobium sp. TaxID=376 RepID=UPI0007C70A03|nr:glycosyltransferase family 2 protein [Bradyrhizobium sp.]MDX3967628.1 glycosyltransferase family 2 protein [Bradyrhizobium sp.]
MISVVVPALNEQDEIGNTVARIKAVLAGAGLDGSEIIVVDDGSADATAARAEQAGALVLRHPHNVGYGRSLKDGIAAARHDLIVINDADGTYPVEAIPELVASMHKGFDMVVGARTGEHYRESLLKMPLRRILRWIVEFTAGRSIPDINSGLRAFRRSIILQYYDHLCDTFSFTTSMTLAYMMTGRFVAYVPIDYNKRVGRSKVKLFRDSMKTLQYIIEAAIYYNPLKMFVLMACLVLAASFVSFVLALVVQLTVFFFIGVGGIISSVIIFSLGLLAVLLRQIMMKSARIEVHGSESRPSDGASLAKIEQREPSPDRRSSVVELASDASQASAAPNQRLG